MTANAKVLVSWFIVFRIYCIVRASHAYLCLSYVLIQLHRLSYVLIDIVSLVCRFYCLSPPLRIFHPSRQTLHSIILDCPTQWFIL